MRLGTTSILLPPGGAVLCRGEFCPAYLCSEQAAARIATYRPEIKPLLCLRPPVDMIYSWYRYNRNAVIASLPDSFAGDDGKTPFCETSDVFGRHLRPYLERFPAKNILVIQFDAIRRNPDRVRQEIYQFLGLAADFRPRLPSEAKKAARAPRFPLLQSGAQRLYARLSAMPRAGNFCYHRRSPRRSKPSITYSTPRPASMSRSPRKSVSSGRPTMPWTRRSSPSGSRAFRLLIDSSQPRDCLGLAYAPLYSLSRPAGAFANEPYLRVVGQWPRTLLSW
jgi:Sulfotransferase domain